MKNSVVELKKYLDNTLNVKVETHPWKGKKELPFFLTDSYDFLEIKLFDKECLVMINKNELEASPAVTRKHWDQVKNIWKGPCFYVQASISSYNRLRLIKHRVPFVIPNKQIYLPDLGVDFRECFEKQLIPLKHLSPAAQATVIYALHNKTREKYTPSVLVKKLGYTHMTMTRVFDELQTANLGEVMRKGKERWWTFEGSKQDLWEQAKMLLRSPVKLRAWTKNHKPPQIIAGLTALAQVTMLTPPALPVYAIGLEEWKVWKQGDLKTLPTPEEAAFELEVWHYDPKTSAKNGMVDLFSLLLSVDANENERVESALEEIKGKIEW